MKRSNWRGAAEGLSWVARPHRLSVKAGGFSWTLVRSQKWAKTNSSAVNTSILPSFTIKWHASVGTNYAIKAEKIQRSFQLKQVLAVEKWRWRIRQQLRSHFIVRVICKRMVMFLHLQRQIKKKKQLSYASQRNTIMTITNNLFCGSVRRMFI